MPQESIILEAPDGTRAPGTGDIVRRSKSSRVVRATLYVLAGLLTGAGSILIPLLHLVSTWLLPLVGIALAYRTMQREFVVRAIEGVCPSCKQAINLSGRTVQGGDWQYCPHCEARLTVRPQAPV